MPEAVHHRAKLVLLDTIGVTLAGAARPEVMGLRERLPIGARACIHLADSWCTSLISGWCCAMPSMLEPHPSKRSLP